MRLSKRCEYGIKAAVGLCLRHGAGYTQSREIAAAEDLPGKFLESILLGMRAAGILVSKVGAGGGYRLAREPDNITILEIVAALDGNGEDGESIRSRIDRPGQAAMGFIRGRLQRSLDESLGTLTLASLTDSPEDGVARRDRSSRRR